VGIVYWIFWGLFVGAIARFLLPGSHKIGVVWTILLGVAGSILGGFLATELLGIGDSDEFDFSSFLVAVGGSVLLMTLAGPFLRRGEKKREAE
jgi:uncharacterized membrane protein YeaQ/YmgE (transglycosylase-associated protein family)